MTKVFMNLDLLAYRLEMKDALRQVLVQNHVTGAPPSIGFLARDG